MNNIYDNGTMVLGQKDKLCKYLIDNSEEMWEIEDILNDIKELSNDSIIAINYDNGMGYSIDYWEESDVVQDV